MISSRSSAYSPTGDGSPGCSALLLAGTLRIMGNHCCDGDTHLERVRSHLVPSGQQWILSSQHTACGRGRLQPVRSSHMTRAGLIPGLNDLYNPLLDHDGYSDTYWFTNIKVRPKDRLRSLTLVNWQQPMEPLGSWQQVASSGHQDLESGQMTPVSPAWTRPDPSHTQFRETTRHNNLITKGVRQ